MTERNVCPEHNQYEPCNHVDHKPAVINLTPEQIAESLPVYTRAILKAPKNVRDVVRQLLIGNTDIDAEYFPEVGAEHVEALDKLHKKNERKERGVEELRFHDEVKAAYAAEKAGDIRAQIDASLYTAEELDKIPPIEWLAPGLLAKNSLAWLYGAPGCYKSFLALDIAASVALGCGLAWSGIPTTQAPVLYIAAEGTGGMKKRVRAWEAMTGQPLRGKVTFLTMPIRITEEAWLAEILHVCAEIRPGLVIIDTQSRVTPGLDENGSVMSLYVEAVTRIQMATGACILTLHHTTKGGDVLRGHGSLYGAADSVIYMARTAGTERYAKVQITKQKDDRDDLFWNIRMCEQHSCGRPEGAEHDDRECRSLVVASARWSDVVAAQTTAYDKVRLIALDLEPNQTMTKATIMEATNLPDSTVKSALKTLCDQGTLTKTGAGKDTAYLRPAEPLDDASASSAVFSQPT
ncbi:AAA family ATPase [Streptomyces gobiensis]|uniref:AAA family ATPase n=1 Tax=Streptomyces gobiensis TaxID=2875706 RepID=UPI001E5B2537|nr:AAA family ATPase [Streptomyces gobiensis]UGY93409.1 helicase RepA family protein [Streptomyces gobiensis]